MENTIKAVLWDFGGVITSSPFEAFNKFEIQEQIPVDFIRQTNAENHETNAWAKLESSEINLDEFDRLFRLETLAKGNEICLLYTSPSPRDRTRSRMPSSA